MSEPADWSIIFYTREDGSSPVVEFLESLDRQTHGRFVWSIEQLRLRNVQAREPLVRHIEGKLWELRRESQTNIYPLFYAFVSGRRILFLHGFQKKSQRTPRQEIDVALTRLDDFTRQQGGE
jgi:phage-related protein